MNTSYEGKEEKLVLLCKAGDDAAFEKLINLYEPMINKSARDMSLDVREVYSDACLSLRRAAESYKFGGGVTFGLYAKICVKRAMIDFAKRNKVAVSDVSLDVDDIAISDGVQSRLEREEELSALKKWAEDVLSELEYEVFSLTLSGYKTAEIVDRLGINSKSVDNAKARMLKRLRAELGNAPKN